MQVIALERDNLQFSIGCFSEQNYIVKKFNFTLTKKYTETLDEKGNTE